jgi:hypothetical protein
MPQARRDVRQPLGQAHMSPPVDSAGRLRRDYAHVVAR